MGRFRYLILALKAVCFGLAMTLLLAWSADLLSNVWNVLPNHARYRDVDYKAPESRSAWGIGRNASLLGENWRVWYPGSYRVDDAPKLLEDAVPDWVLWVDRKEHRTIGNPYEISTWAAGWPFRCLMCSEWDAQSYPAGVRPSLSSRIYTAQSRGRLMLNTGSALDTVKLPFQPIWVGLIGNALFWSGVFVASTVAILRMRAAIRRRRGLCVVCCYERKGLDNAAPCPECGRVGESAVSTLDTAQ